MAASLPLFPFLLMVAASGVPDSTFQDSIRHAHRMEVRSVRDLPAVGTAFRYLEATDSLTLLDQLQLTEIPAPPFQEEARAADFVRRLRAAGADSVWIDEEGNAVGLRRGTGGRGTLAISGHLDTVFPPETDVQVRIRGDTLFAPGIGDDARGLAVVLAVLRALNHAEIETDADLLFIGTVGEEGLGDLRGVKHLFSPDFRSIDAFISVDGLGLDGVTNQGLGSFRYRVTFQGPGGHSWGDFGMAHPAHALARAVAALERDGAPFTATGPPTSFSVGRIGGGTSVNAIPDRAWMEVDMRSESQPRLQAMDSIFRRAVQEGLDGANRDRRRGPALAVDIERIGDRPSGEISADHPFVQRAMAATALLGGDPSLVRSSTDSNVPISMGIAAVTVGGGGTGGGAHSLDEWFLNRRGPIGPQRALLLLLVEAGIPGALPGD